MATTLEDRERLETRRAELRAELASIGDLRPGSLVGRYRKCGKPNCHCASDRGGGHGPSWSLTWKVDGKTMTRIIPADAVEQTREQIAEYQRLRRLTRELIEVSERLCEVGLSGSGAATEVAKKGASERASTRRSSPKSKPS
jgi:hypothetical protein